MTDTQTKATNLKAQKQESSRPRGARRGHDLAGRLVLNSRGLIQAQVPWRVLTLYIVLIALIVALSLWGLQQGEYKVTTMDVINALVGRGKRITVVLVQKREARIVAALLVGAALGLSGYYRLYTRCCNWCAPADYRLRLWSSRSCYRCPHWRYRNIHYGVVTDSTYRFTRVPPSACGYWCRIDSCGVQLVVGSSGITDSGADSSILACRFSR